MSNTKRTVLLLLAMLCCFIPAKADDLTFCIAWDQTTFADAIYSEVGVGDLGSFAVVRKSVASPETATCITVPACTAYHVAVRNCLVEAPSPDAADRCSAWTWLGPAFPFVAGLHCLGLPPAPTNLRWTDRATDGQGG